MMTDMNKLERLHITPNNLLEIGFKIQLWKDDSELGEEYEYFTTELTHDDYLDCLISDDGVMVSIRDETSRVYLPSIKYMSELNTLIKLL